MSEPRHPPAGDVPQDSRPMPSESCPKCRRPRQFGETACARCGLLVSFFARFPVASAPATDPSEIDDLWTGCLEAWGQPAAHDRLLDMATRLAALPAIARRYREHLDREPGDPVAAGRLGRIGILIESAVRAHARETLSSGSLRLFRIVVYVGAGGILFLSAWALLAVLTR